MITVHCRGRSFDVPMSSFLNMSAEDLYREFYPAEPVFDPAQFA